MKGCSIQIAKFTDKAATVQQDQSCPQKPRSFHFTQGDAQQAFIKIVFPSSMQHQPCHPLAYMERKRSSKSTPKNNTHLFSLPMRIILPYCNNLPTHHLPYLLFMTTKHYRRKRRTGKETKSPRTIDPHTIETPVGNEVRETMPCRIRTSTKKEKCDKMDGLVRQ